MPLKLKFVWKWRWEGKFKMANGEGKSSRKNTIIGVVLAVVVLVGGYLAYQSYFYVSTDNATVQAQTTLLSSKISGIVIKADVQENEKVKAGQVLVEIRPDDYQDLLDQLESDRGALAAQVQGADITYRRT